MSKWEKLIQRILASDRSLRFDELRKALINIGYSESQPHGGSSHYTFRKIGCMPVTLPRHSPMNKAYIELVKEIVQNSLGKENEDE